MAVTRHAAELRELLEAHRSELSEILLRYRASNPRLFGSVARGTSTSASDLDILVDLDPDGGNALLRVAGISEELSTRLHTQVDIATSDLLQSRVSDSAMRDAMPL